MVFNLTDKAILLSDNQFHKKNLEKVKQFLVNNSYPTKFITKNMQKWIKKIKTIQIANLVTTVNLEIILMKIVIIDLL